MIVILGIHFNVDPQIYICQAPIFILFLQTCINDCLFMESNSKRELCITKVILYSYTFFIVVGRLYRLVLDKTQLIDSKFGRNKPSQAHLIKKLIHHICISSMFLQCTLIKCYDLWFS